MQISRLKGLHEVVQALVQKVMGYSEAQCATVDGDHHTAKTCTGRPTLKGTMQLALGHRQGTPDGERQGLASTWSGGQHQVNLQLNSAKGKLCTLTPKWWPTNTMCKEVLQATYHKECFATGKEMGVWPYNL